MKAMSYRLATTDDLDRLWNGNIADHPGDQRWLRWRDEAIRYHLSGQSAAFVIGLPDRIIGEGTLLFSPSCVAIGGREDGELVLYYAKELKSMPAG